MSIVYVLPILPPAEPAAEALSQEIALLRDRFGGDLVYVNPNRFLPRPLVPRLGFGWTHLPRLWRMGQRARLYHFFNPDPFAYPFLLALPRPVVYTITSGMDATRPNMAFFRRMAAVTVPDERSLDALRGWGLTNVHHQPAAVQAPRTAVAPATLRPDAPLELLVASAPWTHAQFASKGFDALLAALALTTDVRLTLLWRGVLADEMRRRIAASSVGARVTLIDAVVDVHQALAQAHATALLATRPGLVKSYPHSLLDSLAAGRPVLVSRAIPMADYVERTGCGVVLETVTPEAVTAGVQRLVARYAEYAAAAAHVGRTDFTPAAALDAMAAIYDLTAPTGIGNLS